MVIFASPEHEATTGSDAIERELNDRFTERDTSEQLVFSAEDLPIKVTWKRKCIDAFVEDGKLHRVQTMVSRTDFTTVASFL